MQVEKLAQFLFGTEIFDLIGALSHDLAKSSYALRSIFSELSRGYIQQGDASANGMIHARRLDRIFACLPIISNQNVFERTNVRLESCLTYDDIVELLRTWSLPLDVEPEFRGTTVEGNGVLICHTIANLIYWLGGREVTQFTQEHQRTERLLRRVVGRKSANPPCQHS